MASSTKALTRQYLRELLASYLPPNANFTVSRPTDARFGEFSSNAPHVWAKISGGFVDEAARDLAAKLAPHFAGRIEIQSGHLNFFMSDTTWMQTLETAAREGALFGSGDSLSGQRVLVEYVSSDPTGFLPFGAGRAAAAGETLCRLLEYQGARVTREFYLNDATSSSKIQSLGEEVSRWYLAAFGRRDARLDSAAGDAFVRGVASELARREGAQWLDVSGRERLERCSRAALEAAVEAQRDVLERFGTRFDDWVSETRLRAESRVGSALERLVESGHTFERDGALWLQTSKFGDETDRVLRRANGEPTYFAGDIAYNVSKFERGFSRIINLWSAEHRPYIERTRAALRAAQIDEDRFEFLTCESAVLKRDGVRLQLGMGGGAPLLSEEIEEVGEAPLKWFFLSAPMSKRAEVELEVAARDEESNPSYAARLLPSRLARLLREAEGARLEVSSTNENGEFAPGERELARLVALWPDEALEATTRREPERVARFVDEMSRAVKSLLVAQSPREAGAPNDLRLQLLRAAQHVATSALRLMGVEAREKF